MQAFKNDQKSNFPKDAVAQYNLDCDFYVGRNGNLKIIKKLISYLN